MKGTNGMFSEVGTGVNVFKMAVHTESTFYSGGLVHMTSFLRNSYDVDNALDVMMDGE
jgi:hypothetical protein